MNVQKLTLIAGMVISVTMGVLGQQGAPVPKLVSMPDPAYPVDGIALGFGGKIRVYVEVNKEGKPKVVGTAGPIAPCSDQDSGPIKRLREAAVQAAKKGVFEPVLKDGKPVDSFAAVTFQVPGPTPPDSEKVPQDLGSGVIRGRVYSLPKPEYPRAARAARAGGAVQVQIFISHDGSVSGAGPLTGDPLLHEAAVKAACQAKFRPTELHGKPVTVTGIVTYNFMP